MVPTLPVGMREVRADNRLGDETLASSERATHWAATVGATTRRSEPVAPRDCTRKYDPPVDNCRQLCPGQTHVCRERMDADLTESGPPSRRTRGT